MLLTDDGQWNHRLPRRHHCLKKLSRAVGAAVDKRLKKCCVLVLQLDGEKKPTKPAQLFLIDENRLHIRLIINEGKYHPGETHVGSSRQSCGGIYILMKAVAT